MHQPKDTDWLNGQKPYICCLQETHFRPKDTFRLKVRWWKNTFYANGKQKKAGVAILVSDKIDLKIVKITKGRTVHNDQGINPRGRHNNCKYLGTQHWRRWWHPTPVLLPGKSRGQRSPVGCSPWGCSESDRTELLHFHFSPSCIGEGNGSPVQYSCLENPRDRGAWWAAVSGVAQSRTRLKRLSSSSSRHPT